MPYNNNSGWVASTIEEITQNYITQINLQFGTNYTSDNYEGSGFWRMYLPAVLRDKEIENALVDLLQFIKDDIQNLSDSFFYNQAGLETGIRKALLDLNEIVKDVSIYNPQNVDSFRGKIGIAIEYVNDDLKEDDNASTLIANAIINNIGAGIHTDSNDFDKEALGIVKENNQVFAVFWKFAVIVKVILKIQYKKDFGVTLPDATVIKQTLLEKLKSYNFGGVFTPDKYVDLCDFNYFREVKLLYSLDNGEIFSETEITPKYYEKWVFSEDNITLENTDEL